MPEIVKVEPTRNGYRLLLSCGHKAEVEATKAGLKPKALAEELEHTKPQWACRPCGKNRSEL